MTDAAADRGRAPEHRADDHRPDDHLADGQRPDAAREAERVVAAYPDGREARQAVDHLQTVGFRDGDVHLDDDRDRLLLADGDRQIDEAADTVAVMSGGLTTRSQTRGALFGSVIGGTVGFVLSVPFWLIPIDVAGWLRIVAWAAVGTIAGSTIGFVYGGARLPQRRGEHTDTPVGTTVSADVRTDAEAALARSILSEQARRRADARATQGTVPPDPSAGRAAAPRRPAATAGDETGTGTSRG